MDDLPAACLLCGTHGDASDPTGASALAWSVERGPDGRQRRLCPDCARRHVRDIEARLPHEWW
ncbi:MAG TPA: hypothetical protein VD813_14595 [Pseudonocardia sp.]|nr:hypothetical protein [Pseudonocardia sp.]